MSTWRGRSTRVLRLVVIATLTGLLMAACGNGDAGDYPSDSIEVVVPFPAGGGADLAIRTLQPVLEEELGQSLVVLNKGGGGGAVGTAEAAAAEPDGYTWLLITVGPAATQPHLQDVPYTPESFAPVLLVNNEPLLVVVPADSELADFEDLAAAAAGGELTWAAPPVGGVPHLTGEMILQDLGATARMVPFDGTGPAATALLGDQIDVASLPAATIGEHIDEGTLRALATTSPERLPDLPDVPSLSELGHDVVVTNWNGIALPADTPSDIIDTVHAALVTAIESDSYQELVARSRLPLDIVTPDEFRQLWDNDYERFGTLIDTLKASGVLE